MAGNQQRGGVGGQEAGAVAPLIAIFPKWVVITLAIVSFAAPTLFLVSLFLMPHLLAVLNTETGRYFFALAISLHLTLFLFVLYPQQITLSKIPVIGIPMRLVGPPALWIVILLFLLRVLPLPAAGRFFQPRHLGRAVEVRVGSITLSPKPQGKQPEYYLVPDRSDDRKLAGIYVMFGADEPDCEAVVKVTGREETEVRFERGGGESIFEVGNLSSK